VCTRANPSFLWSNATFADRRRKRDKGWAESQDSFDGQTTVLVLPDMSEFLNGMEPEDLDGGRGLGCGKSRSPLFS